MYLAFEGFDTQNGTNHLALTMIDEFLSSGIKTYLVTSHSLGLYEDIPALLKDRDGFSYDIIRRPVVSKTNFIQRYWDGLTYSLRCMKAWKKKIRDIDVVILQSTPTAFFSAILLRWFGGKPIIYNCFDVFPDGAYACGAIGSRLLYSILRKMQHVLYNCCERIVVISSDMKRTFVNQGIPEDKLIEIRNWYDEKFVRPVEFSKNRFAQKYQLSDRNFYVQYAGNYGFNFDYKLVIEVADLLSGFGDIVFQMVGTGAFEKDFKREVEARGLRNVVFYPWQPLDMISDVYSACSVQFIPLAKGVIFNSFPSKGSLLMACGKAIVCATECESDYYKMVNANEIGICVPNTSPQKAADAILSLYRSPERLRQIGENARVFGAKYYSSTHNVRKYIRIVRERSNVLGRGGAHVL